MTVHKQSTALSCGAACLAVAGRELGLQDFLLPGRMHPDGNGQNQAVALNGTTSSMVMLETMLYAVTGKGKDGYSMPADICKAALMMGLEPKVYMDSMVIAPALNKFYPEAAQQCDQYGVTVTRTAAPPLTANQRQLCVVCIGGLPLLLHWVLYRPDGTYMDPASGEDFNYFIAMGQGPLYVLKYLDTGISIVVEA